MAVDEINRGRGTHFDPAVVDAFAELNPEDLVNPAESVPGIRRLGRPDRRAEVRPRAAVG